MAVSQAPNGPVGRDTKSGRTIWGWLLRLTVPVPTGKGWRGKSLWIVRRVVYWYIIILVMLTLFQRSLIYRPTRSETIDPEFSGLSKQRVEKVTVTTDDGLTLHGWFVRAMPEARLLAGDPRHDGAALHPVVIYFPGNAGHRGYRTGELDLMSRLGADVYLFDYRGYGDNSGSPSEEKLAADAHAIWNDVTGKRGAKPSNVVILGESLGGGVAARLASEVCTAGKPPRGLILRSTFSSLVDIASYYYWWLPVRTFLTERFPSTERIAMVTCPILVVHGTNDQVVPLSYGRRLYEAAPKASSRGVAKNFAALSGAGHDDILFVAYENYQQQVRGFFDRLEPAD